MFGESEKQTAASLLRCSFQRGGEGLTPASCCSLSAQVSPGQCPLPARLLPLLQHGDGRAQNNVRQQRVRREGTLTPSPRCLEPVSDRTGKTISNIFKLPWYLIRRKMQSLLAELVVSGKGKVPVGVQRGSSAEGTGSAPHTAAPRQLGTAGTGDVRRGRPRGTGQQRHTAPTQPPSPAFSLGCQAVFALPISTIVQGTEALSSYRTHLSSIPTQLRFVAQELPAGSDR